VRSARTLARTRSAATPLLTYNSFDSHGWLDDLPDSTRRKINLVRGDIRDAAFVYRLVPGHVVSAERWSGIGAAT
jgi:hypothetical protein